MWKFWAKAGSDELPQAVQYILGRERGLDGTTMARLRMVQEQGAYAQRKVTLFRVYDPAALGR